MSNAQRAADARQQLQEEARQPDFVVRAKCGVHRKAWVAIGVAWKRQNGEGYSLALKATPMTINNQITLKLLPPMVPEEDSGGDEDQV